MRTLKVFAISAILLLGLAACGNGNSDADDRYDDCVPPYACGPSYAGYVPMYYQLHPYSLYLTPYASWYNYSYVGGHMIVTRSNPRPFTSNNVRISAPSNPTYNKAATTTANKSNTGTTSKTNTGTGTKPVAPAVKPPSAPKIATRGK